MPLVRTRSCASRSREAVTQLDAPEAVRAGLYLYISCWDEAHSAADASKLRMAISGTPSCTGRSRTPEIPLTGSTKQALTRSSRNWQLKRPIAVIQSGPSWDPFAFIQFCETAGKRPGSNEERVAQQVQLLEWQLLFDHCARGSAC